MYQSTINNHNHLSIGAIAQLRDKRYMLHNNNGIYRMMTGTLEINETPAQCLHRELLEEFGATCKINSYIGTTINNVNVGDDRGQFTKTIIWHHVTILTMGAPRTDDLDCVIELVDHENTSSLNIDFGRWPIKLKWR